jgi:hypothetical protein
MRKRKGLALNRMNGLIAAMVVVLKAVLCSRDEDGFAGLGLAVINPFGATMGRR